MEHVESVDEGRFSQCEECNEEYRNKGGLVGHMGTVHTINKDLNKTIKMAEFRQFCHFLECVFGTLGGLKFWF